MAVERGGPGVAALGTVLPGLPVAVHDGLQDGREGRDADAGRDQRRVLRVEYMRRRRAVRTVDINLINYKKKVLLRSRGLRVRILMELAPRFI